MNTTVFGANGNVGQFVVKELVERGHSVVAATHNTNPFENLEQIKTVEVDVFDSNSVNNAVNGSNAVISCLGSWGTQSKKILTEGMKAIIPAMEATKITRIVTVTGAAAKLPDEDFGPIDSINRKVLRLVAKQVVDDGEQHLRLLQQSPLAWTSLRSPVMNNFGQFTYKLTSNSPLPTQTINRQAVACALVDLVESKEHLKQAPFIARD